MRSRERRNGTADRAARTGGGIVPENSTRAASRNFRKNPWRGRFVRRWDSRESFPAGRRSFIITPPFERCWINHTCAPNERSVLRAAAALFIFVRRARLGFSPSSTLGRAYGITSPPARVRQPFRSPDPFDIRRTIINANEPVSSRRIRR